MLADGRSEKGKLVVVGQGYVGLPLAIRACEVGYRVVGYDVDTARISRLSRGTSYVHDVSSDRVRSALDSKRFLPTDVEQESNGFDIAVITVPTPLRDGAPDLQFIVQSARALSGYLREGATVVLESTTYPGTTEELVRPILEEGSHLKAGVDFHLGYSPERIDPGSPTWGLENTPKIVSGLTHACRATVESFYQDIVERTVPVSSVRVAELTKLLENTFRHVNIALVNELAMFAHDLDIDVWEAVDAASTKPFGYMRFTPGPGVGGHCLPVDPSYLSWRVKRTLGQNFRFVELANDVNDHMPDYVVRRLIGAMNARRAAMNGSRILVLGLAYKKNTSDARESPSIRVIALLQAMGCEVRVADPYVVNGHSAATQVELSPAEVAAADAVVILVDHDSFDLNLVSERASYVLDTRRCITGPRVEYL